MARVLLFDPTNCASAAYNPLLEVRRSEWEVRDVQNVADILVGPEGSLERRNHWEKTRHSPLVAGRRYPPCPPRGAPYDSDGAIAIDCDEPSETVLLAPPTQAGRPCDRQLRPKSSPCETAA